MMQTEEHAHDTYDTFAHATADKLRQINKYLDRQGNEHCAKIAAVWYQIKQTTAWQRWDYESLEDAITEEGPRGRSTVLELICDYEHFVIFGRMSYEEFEHLFIQYGIKRVAILRMQTAGRESEPATDEPHDEPRAEGNLGQHDDEMRTTDDFKRRVHQAAKKLGTLTVAEAKRRYSKTITAPFVNRTYSFTPEQDQNVQDAISHLLTRVRGEYKPNLSTALAYVAAEYLAAYGNRQVVR